MWASCSRLRKVRAQAHARRFSDPAHAKAREDEAALRVCGAEDLPRWCAGHGHMAPCVVKALAEGSASYACGGISPGDILISVDGVPVRQMFA